MKDPRPKPNAEKTQVRERAGRLASGAGQAIECESDYQARGIRSKSTRIQEPKLTVGDVGEGVDEFCDVGRNDIVLFAPAWFKLVDDMHGFRKGSLEGNFILFSRCGRAPEIRVWSFAIKPRHCCSIGSIMERKNACIHGHNP